MSTDLRTQLAAYGDLFAAELDTLTVEDAMDTRVGEGNVKALEPVRRREDKDQRRKGIWLAAAVFALVVAVGIAMALAVRGSNEVANIPAPPFETGTDAAESIRAAVSSGDYETFTALFANDAADFFGGDAVTDERERERFVTESLGPKPISDVGVSCTPISERSWTCTFPWPNDGFRRVVKAAGLLGGSIILAEQDVTLSDDGHIARASVIRPAGETTPAQQEAWGEAWAAFQAWLASNHPDLDESLFILYNRSNHETDPLPMTPAEIANGFNAAIEEYEGVINDG